MNLKDVLGVNKRGTLTYFNNRPGRPDESDETSETSEPNAKRKVDVRRKKRMRLCTDLTVRCDQSITDVSIRRVRRFIAGCTACGRSSARAFGRGLATRCYLHLRTLTNRLLFGVTLTRPLRALLLLRSGRLHALGATDAAAKNQALRLLPLIERQLAQAMDGDATPSHQLDQSWNDRRWCIIELVDRGFLFVPYQQPYAVLGDQGLVRLALGTSCGCAVHSHAMLCKTRGMAPMVDRHSGGVTRDADTPGSDLNGGVAAPEIGARLAL